MAYDLVVGQSQKVKHTPEIVGGIEFEELAIISKLVERTSSFFLTRLKNLYADQIFGLAELEQAQMQLFELMLQELDADERAFVYKMSAVVAFALDRKLVLHGVAD